jgi:hypothetical protein
MRRLIGPAPNRRLVGAKLFDLKVHCVGAVSFGGTAPFMSRFFIY